MGKNRKKIYMGNAGVWEETPTWHRSVIGLLFGIAVMTLVAFLSGCADNTCECDYRLVGVYERAVSPKLLLRSQNDPAVDPQVFAYRSDWPAAVGEIEFGRVTTYSQYWYDRQSATPDIPDFSYKQIRSYRYGTSIR